MPHRITLTWSNPGASDLAGVVVQRGWAGCPATQHDGVRVGGTGIRHRQVDTKAAPGTTYCYAVFAFDRNGNFSRAALARHVIDRVPPPTLHPVTDIQPVATKDGHIELTWRNPASLAGVASIEVVRGPASACPTGPADGTQIGGSAVRDTQVDTTAKPGSAYCYRVFVMNASGQSQESATHMQTAPAAPAAAHPSDAADPPASSSGGWLTSTIVRMVAAVGAAMLLVMAAATVVTRRRGQMSAYVAPREYVPRMALTGVTPATLVIPGLLVVGSAAAIVLVLLNH